MINTEEVTAAAQSNGNSVTDFDLTQQGAIQILERITDGFISVDREWRYTYINRAGAEMAGRAPAEFIGKTIWEIYPEAVGTKFQTEYERALRDHVPVVFEEYLASVELWLEVNAYPSESGLSVFFRNITEKKLAEARLRESEELLQGTINALTGHIAVLDKHGVIVKVNETWRKFAEQNLFQGANYGIGQNYIEACIPNDKEPQECDPHGVEAAEGIRKVASGELNIFELEYPCHSPNEQRWFIMRVTRFNESKDDLRVVVAHENVTERKLAEIASRESKEQYRNLFNTIDEGFCTCEVIFDGDKPIDYRLLEANPAFERLTGINAQEALSGKTILEVVPSLERHWVEIYGRVAWTGEAERFEQGSDTLGSWFDVYAFRVGEPEERKVAILFSNITTRKNYEKELRESQEKLRRTAKFSEFSINLADALRPLSDPAEIQTTAGRVLGEWFNADRVLYFEVRDGEYFVERDYTNNVPSLAGKGYAIASFDEKMLATYRSGRVAWSPDVAADKELSDEEHAAFAAVQIGAYIGAPIVKNGEFVAGLSVQMREPRDWTADDIALVEDAAERTWEAVTRARVEEALRESDTRLRLAIDISRTATFDIDLLTNAVETDEIGREMYGFEADEQLTFDQIQARFHSDDHDEVMRRVTAAFAPTGSDEFEVEQRIIRTNGETRWIRVRGRAFFDGTGETRRAVRCLGTYIDITDSKKAVEALSESEARFRYTFEQSPVGVLQINVDGTLKAVNPAYCKLIGYEAHELVGKSPVEWTPVEDHAADRAFRESFLDNPLQQKSHEKRYIRKDGEVIWVYLTVTGVRDDSGNLFGVGIVQDITERKRAEEKLKESEALFRELSEVLPAGVFIVKEDKHIYANAQAETMTGYAREELLNISPFELTNEVGHQQIADIRRARMENPNVSTAYEMPLITKSGELRWVLSCSTRITLGGETAVLLASFDITDQRRAQEALRESEIRFRNLSDSAPVLIWVYDTEGCEYVNRQYLDFVGVSELEDVRGIDWAQFVHPDDYDDYVGGFFRAFERREKFTAQLRFRRRDGEYRWMTTTGLPRISASGEFLGYVGSTLDIDDLKRAEEALQESQDRLLLALQVGRAGTYQWNIKQNTNVWSPEIEQIYGVPAGTFEGTYEAWAERVVKEDEERVRQGLEAALKSRLNEYIYEFRAILPDGSHRWLEGRSRFEYDADENPLRMYGINVDITDRKQAEQALRESEERFRNMADNAPVMVWVTEKEGHCSFLSKSWYEFTGQMPETGLGFGWISATHPDDQQRAHDIFIGATEQQKPFSIEYRLRRKDGSYAWAIDSAIPRISPEGEFLGFIGSVIDITERKQMEDALREADRRKDEFLATLAHELRNPLAPIQTALEIMRSGADKEKGQEAREIAARQIEQMRHLIDDLLDISRITQGKIVLKMEKMDLRDAIQSAIETSLPLIEANKHQFNASLPYKPVYVEGDAVRLSQIFLNLLNNAAKFTDAGGRIDLTTAIEGNEVVVKVRDTGAGIPPEMLESIFEMFSQVEKTGSRPQGGLGIGLNLVKRLTEKHGGTVTAASEGKNKGSEFTVRLPLTDVQKPEMIVETITAASSSEPRKVRLLVVDDNADAADMMSFALSLEKHEIKTVYNGTDAIAAADELQPDACLLDIGLPDIDGYNVAKTIRAKMPDTLLIALSGWGQEEDRRRSSEAGFNHHLVKPVKIDEVIKLLTELKK